MKWIGAAIVLIVCSGFGASCAARYKLEEKNLKALIAVLDYMECELQYRLTPLPELCRLVAGDGVGTIYDIFRHLAQELELQLSPDVSGCMRAAVSKSHNLPEISKKMLLELGQSMGRFDLPGQLQSLESARRSCRQELDRLAQNREVRLRSYQTLGICAGTALVILFI